MFKIRASGAGKIMTNPTGKSNLEKYNDAVETLSNLKTRLEGLVNKTTKTYIDISENKIPNTVKLIAELEPIKDKVEISETTKAYVYDYLKERIYGYRKEISNKYIDKGLTLEDEAIDKAIELLDLPFTLKNEESFENDYFTGTPDLIIDGVVYDIKCSWDCFTFPLFETEIPTKDYYYQLQVYMHLLGIKKAVLVYVLLDTPENVSAWETIKKYNHLDKKYRIKTYDVEYSEEVIADLQQRVTNIREFIKTLDNE